MLCFQFLGDSGFEVVLCEEAIRYSAHRDDGVRVGANVLVRIRSPQTRFLYALHRRAFSQLQVAKYESWTEEETGFPYSWLFSRICKERLLPQPAGDFILKQFATSSPEKVAVLPNRTCPGFAAVEEMSGSADPDAPFSLLRFGPFPESDGCFLFRFEFCISDSSYRDLIPEQATTATKFYRVYGPEHIRRDIETVDIPRAEEADSAKYSRYAQRLLDFPPESVRVPRSYSIVAVDHPNCNPAVLRCLDLTSDLREVTGTIDPAVYDHAGLGKIRDRLHWFVSEEPSKGFYLQLSGPMALSDICQTVSAQHAA